MNENLVFHYLNGVQFTPINKDEFTLSFGVDQNVRWTNLLVVSGKVDLPEEAYIELNNHLENIGAQQAIDYNLVINGQTNAFMAKLTDSFQIGATQAEIDIVPYKSANNVIDNLSYTTWEQLRKDGFIKDSDFVNIPYVVVKDNQAELMIQCAIMIYVLADQLAESIATTARLIGELIAAATPDIVVSVSPGTTINVGTYIKYGLLIALEIAKSVLLTLALIELTKQMFELILPPLRYLKAMTFDKLLTIGLGSQGITYQSTLTNHFKACTLIPIPIDYQNKKFWEVLGVNDQRILNRGYPTSSDTTPTVMSLIEEITKMYNLEPTLDGNVLYLNPKGYVSTIPKVDLQYNMNDQDGIQQVLTADVSGLWHTKIISYTNDSMDLHLFDNPRGLACEYKSRPNNMTIYNEKTILKGLEEIRINFALGTIKKETKIEKELKKIAKSLDSFLGTNLLNKVKNRDGVLVLSSNQFNVSKVIYQKGGRQLPNYLNFIGANALYTNYHTIDEPKNNAYEVYSNMPVAMNNAQFLGVIRNKYVTLEGMDVEVLTCDYVPELATAEITYRKRNTKWSKNIITELVHAE